MSASLNVAVQMDALDSINVAGDSTFALMLGALQRGHRLLHYTPEQLDWVEGRVIATARPVEVRRPKNAGESHYSWLGDARPFDLGKEIDVVLMRQDPPFDLSYISASHLLERAQALGVTVVNDPAAVRNAPEKLFVLNYADLMPPTLVTRSLEATKAFRERHGEIVIKPLYGYAGGAVFHLGRDDTNMPALVELFSQVWREPFMVQAFLPAVAEGDKRIVLIDGEEAGAINRLPKDGEIRSNLAAGGSAHETRLTAEEVTICERIGPDLKRLGLMFVGIDVIGGRLTEINVTSPTGIVAIDAFNGTDTPARFWQHVEAMRAAR